MIRSGLLTEREVLDEVSSVIVTEHAYVQDTQATAASWIRDEREAWIQDAAGWPLPTDYDRLQGAFAELRGREYLVLEGCLDHWTARDALAETPSARGVAWFVSADVWHAIDEPMLEINLWHPSTANAAAGDDLVAELLLVFAEHELRAVFDEGRIEVAALWRRLPDHGA